MVGASVSAVLMLLWFGALLPSVGLAGGFLLVVVVVAVIVDVVSFFNVSGAGSYRCLRVVRVAFRADIACSLKCTVSICHFFNLLCRSCQNSIYKS